MGAQLIHYHTSHTVDAPLRDVWAFFERHDAFEQLNPPWSQATLVKKRGGLEVGAEVHLKLPLGIRWVVVHTAYEKERYFVDRQQSGPFKQWQHRHSFETVGDKQTRLDEQVEFSLPLAWLLNPLLGWFVKRSLDRLFAYRREVLQLNLKSEIVSG